MFETVNIILVETSHPGNIGSAARAMKAMGFQHLSLVNPKFFPDEQANILASGADDILTNAHVYSSFETAIADCDLIIGTSARARTLPISILEPRACAELIAKEKAQKIAIVFGRENSGLTNEELLTCHYHLYIPTDEHFYSLNLAQAVQIICYELRLIMLEKKIQAPESYLATGVELQGFYEHLETLLIQVDFFKSNNLESLLKKLKRLFQRARLEKTEVNILRGIMTAIQKKINV